MSPRVIKKVQTQLEKQATENIEQLWRDRSMQVREAEYKAAQRILDFNEEMEDAELLLKGRRHRGCRG
jgi:vacuolar-type H+-ATPase subunit H